MTVKVDKLYLSVWWFFPDAETQIMFHDSYKVSFTLSFISWFNDKKAIHIELEHQVDIGLAHEVNSPEYLIVTH